MALVEPNHDILDDGQIEKQTTILKRAPYTRRCNLMHGFSAQQRVVQIDMAGRTDIAADRIEKSGFAGPVRADNRADLARRDIKADVGHRPQAGKLDADMFELQPWGHGAAPRGGPRRRGISEHRPPNHPPRKNKRRPTSRKL